MSKLILYGMELSPCVRFCLLTLKALNVPYEYKHIDLYAGENRTEEFVKMNPLHTVPVLDDNGTYITDSHSICIYLVEKYGKSDKLYPKDLVKRTVINQRLFFDATVIYTALRSVVMPYYRHQITVVPKEVTADVLEVYGFIETYLADSQYLAGEEMTIADLGSVAIISSLNGVFPIDVAKCPKTKAWLERLSHLPYYQEANGKGDKDYVDFVKSFLTDIQY